MSTYELDDDLVREWLRSSPGDNDLPLVMALKDQVPLPTPTNVGAVVRTVSPSSLWIRWTYDAHSHEPWIEANDTDNTYRSDQIGRITEVLFEGVEPK